MSAAKTKAQTLINENGVVVFSKSYCPYCTASKKLLNELGAKFTALELDTIGECLFVCCARGCGFGFRVAWEVCEGFRLGSSFIPLLVARHCYISTESSPDFESIEDGSDIQNALEELSSQRTVPNIFINQKHIGGNSDLQAKKGQLPALLKEAGAL